MKVDLKLGQRLLSFPAGYGFKLVSTGEDPQMGPMFNVEVIEPEGTYRKHGEYDITWHQHIGHYDSADDPERDLAQGLLDALLYAEARAALYEEAQKAKAKRKKPGPKRKPRK